MTSFTRIFFTACLMAGICLSAAAQENTDANTSTTVKSLAKLLDADTIFVLHVDFTKIDTDKVFRNNRALFDKSMNSLGMTDDDKEQLLVAVVPDEKEREFVKNQDRLSGIVSAGKTFLTETLGVKEAFATLKIDGRSFVTLTAAIPMHDGLNTAMLDTLLARDAHYMHCADADFYWITYDSNAKQNDLNADKTAEKINVVKVRERPELIEAFHAVEGYPIRLLYAAPNYVKRTVDETFPPIAKPFDKIEFKKFLTGIRWKAVGIDPEQPKLFAVGEAETELDAQVIYHSDREWLTILAQTQIAKLKQYANSLADERKKVDEGVRNIFDAIIASGTYQTLVDGEKLQAALDRIIPKPEGKRFTVTWDGNTLQNAVQIAGPVVAEIIRSRGHALQRMQVANNMKAIGLGMFIYHDVYKKFPPAYTVDKNGKPLHSWRVLILPYIGQEELYKRIRLDEPWDSEYNKQFHNVKIPTYFNPYCKSNQNAGDTNFCLVTGNKTFGQTNGEGISISKLTDGTSNTIMAIERQKPVCWMAPVDIKQEDAFLGFYQKDEGIGGDYPGGVNVLGCDGAVHFLSDTTDLQKLKALMTISGGESVGF
ncbi:MAG: DUF1559 domain-containing protein [Planctomycetaceae bacterium]|nr:DUF1559 domain-containing protein [Planctomycetaceae bacterium]